MLFRWFGICIGCEYYDITRYRCRYWDIPTEWRGSCGHYKERE